MDEVELTGDEAAIANRIKAVDAELDALDERTKESVILGLHGYGAALTTNLAQTAADKQQAALLAERADLVQQLKRLDGDAEQGS